MPGSDWTATLSHGTSVDGLVTAGVTGLLPSSLDIDPSLLDPGRPHKLEAALREAINAARSTQLDAFAAELVEFAAERRDDSPLLAELHDRFTERPADATRGSRPEPESRAGSADHQVTVVVMGDRIESIRVARSLFDPEQLETLTNDVIQATQRAFTAQHAGVLESLDPANHPDRRFF